MISCLCATAGRVSMLEEAIECFHQQDYKGDKELIVLNNHPAVTLEYRHPEVRVVNVPVKIATLSDARNFMVSLSRGDQLTMWDDDDIHLPWRLRVGVQALEEGYDYWRPYGCWFWAMESDPVMVFPNPLSSFYAATAVYTKQCFRAVGGYPISERILDDQVFDHLVDMRGMRAFRGVIPIRDYAYLYRWKWTWNVSDTQDNPFGWEATWPADRQGTVELQPHWDRDYIVIADGAAEAVMLSDPNRRVQNSPVDLHTFLRGQGKR